MGMITYAVLVVTIIVLMLHLCRMGPLTSTWCLRMEAKNSCFKKIAQIGNFQNIAFSVAKRHQRLACAYLQSANFFTEHEVGPCNSYYNDIHYVWFYSITCYIL